MSEEIRLLIFPVRLLFLRSDAAFASLSFLGAPLPGALEEVEAVVAPSAVDCSSGFNCASSTDFCALPSAFTRIRSACSKMSCVKVDCARVSARN